MDEATILINSLLESENDIVSNNIIKGQQFQALLRFCENLEVNLFEGYSEKRAATARSLQMLSYLILNDLDNARFLWKRVEFDERSEELTALWKIGSALWKQDHESAYDAMSKFDWSEITKPFVAHLRESTRAHMLTLLAKSYSSISLESCTVELGMSREDCDKPLHCLSDLISVGWTIEGNIARPPTIQPSQDTNIDAQKQLQQLTEYICHLESK
eukprot:110622_1